MAETHLLIRLYQEGTRRLSLTGQGISANCNSTKATYETRPLGLANVVQRDESRSLSAIQLPTPGTAALPHNRARTTAARIGPHESMRD